MTRTNAAKGMQGSAGTDQSEVSSSKCEKLDLYDNHE